MTLTTTAPHDEPAAGVRPAEAALLASVFIVAACGLVYELAAGTLASYLLGDSILQFSTVIGSYLFAMGVGSYLSRFFERQLIAHFLRIELLVGLVGGLMPAALFALQSAAAPSFRFALYALVLLIGILVGLEIPLVMRILKRQLRGHAGAGLKTIVSQVLTFDYLGALAVSIAFPLVLVPQLGLIRTGAFFGLLNAFVAVWALWLFRGELRRIAAHALACGLTVAALVAALVGADHVTTWAEDRFYADHVLFAETSAYQRVVVTASRFGVRLFLNGNLQFHSRDEYRYHEALVHPAMAAHGAAKRVLVLGGGDGMAAREILKYPSVESVTLVELDPHMTRLFRTQPLLRELNHDSLLSPKLHVVNEDAFSWLEHDTQAFDVIVIDFPDPTNFSIGKALHDELLPARRGASECVGLRGRADDLAAGRAQELLDRRDHARSPSASRRRRTTRMCRASANGVSSSRAIGPTGCRPRCRRACAFSIWPGCRRCSTSRPTWRACRPRSIGCRTRCWCRASTTNGARCADARRRQPARMARHRRAAAAGGLHAHRVGLLRGRLGRRSGRARTSAARAEVGGACPRPR